MFRRNKNSCHFSLKFVYIRPVWELPSVEDYKVDLNIYVDDVSFNTTLDAKLPISVVTDFCMNGNELHSRHSDYLIPTCAEIKRLLGLALNVRKSKISVDAAVYSMTGEDRNSLLRVSV